MDTDINDIWDLPLENPIPHSPVNNLDGDRPTSPPRASNPPPLFLPSDEEEDAAPNAIARNDANNNPDVDALFEGLDDLDDSFQELAPALDLDALRREADARNARAVRAELGVNTQATELSASAAGTKTKSNGGRGGALDGLDGDGEDDGKKKRKPLPKLDEARLLGKDGFLQLLKDTKNFKPKGKGHEAVDLDRVLQVYQFWTHKLYPKTRFKETVDRVEKLCHSKRMQVALSVWRDEAKGFVNGVRLSPAEDSDEDSDADAAPRGNEVAGATADEGAAASSTSQPSSPARSRLRPNGGGGDSDRDSVDPHFSSDAPRPPSSSPDRDEATEELDALLEMEEASRESNHNTTSTGHTWKTSNDNAVAMDEDEDLWDSLDTSAVASVPATAPAPAPPAMDDDQGMWDIMHELEQEKAKETAHGPDPVHVPPAASDAQPEMDDLDDMYL